MKRKHRTKLLGAVGMAITAVAMMAPLAQAETPAPGYGQFAGCPSPKSENSEIATCMTSTVTGGHLHLGNKETPLSVPITISGGINDEGGGFDYNSLGGLSKGKQKVNGGVIGLTGLTWLAEFLGVNALTLYGTAELAGTPKINTVEDIELPIKVHLENTTGVLGPKCYVGTTAKPINLHLVTTTEPTYVFDPETEIVKATGGVFTDNTFSAPGASGCVLTLFGVLPVNIDNIINLASGLPAATGNHTTQNYDLEIVEADLAYP